MKGKAGNGARPRRAKAQSAMEYLMTYGWSILIIAIVLGVLYYLGVFNSATLAPMAQPGSCQVFRPNGAGTSYDAGLSGTCNNELPEYVAQFNGQGTGGPASSAIITQLSHQYADTGGTTFTGWIYPYSLPSGNNLIIISTSPEFAGFDFVTHGTSLWFYACGPGNDGGGTLNADTWQFVAATVSSDVNSLVTLYIDGVVVSTNQYSGTLGSKYGISNYWAIGSPNGCSGGSTFNGLISNVQIYNTSLSQEEITALYDEGIGGAPVRLQNIAGWWPLNGNAEDYSGNNYDGTTKNVTYINSWTNGYAAP